MDTPSQFFDDAACEDPTRDGYFNVHSVPGLKTEPDIEDATLLFDQPDDVLLAAQFHASKSRSQKMAPELFDGMTSAVARPGQLKLEPDMISMKVRRSQRQTRGSTTTVTTADSQGSSTTHSTSPTLDQHSATSSDPPAEPPPSPPKKQKRKKAPGSSMQSVKDDPKRDVFLQRNRVAASKCRQKKKEWMSDLQETKQELENQNMQMHAEYNGLLGEITSLKDQLMSHAACNDRNIDLWLEAEARRFAFKTSKRFNPAGGPTGPVEQPLLPGTMSMNPGHLATAPTSVPPHSMPLDPSLMAGPGAAARGEINYDHMPDSIFENNSQDGH